MTTITIYKTPDVQVTVQTGDPPIDQSALVAQLTADIDYWLELSGHRR